MASEVVYAEVLPKERVCFTSQTSDTGDPTTYTEVNVKWHRPDSTPKTTHTGTTASYLEGATTETTGFTQSFTEEGITKILDEVTTSGSRGRRSEYIAEYDSMTEEDYMTDEPSIISTEQHVQKRTFEHSISLNEGSVIGDPCEFLFLFLLGLLWFGLFVCFFSAPLQ
ncbi:uncharacterized protein AAGF69_004438 isoform 2-T2 [Amazona ochrocephala]